ncbi:MAG: transglycosylase SLT domain-containing protein [Candidatus Aegiribacteria sp.]|nr:transglycosylase SLT domain-containing protein [Candidatus Aegiribacteria sp.]
MPSTGNKHAVIVLLLAVALIGCRTLQPDENHVDNLSSLERSILAEFSGDSLLREGLEEQARDAYLRAAMLRTQQDTLRASLVWKAAGSCDLPSLITAQLLLEQSDSLAPYRSLELGGAGIGEELFSLISRNDCVMPEYLRLVLADSLIEADSADLALRVLSGVPVDLPERALRRRIILSYRGYLETGQLTAADSLLSEVESMSSDELLSLLYHYKGIWMLKSGIPGYREVLLQSFELWPAAPVHAAAYDELRLEILNDRNFAASVAAPFYSGGLWNELYDIARSSTDPDPHLWYLAARTRDRLGFYETAVSMLDEYLVRWPASVDAPNAMIYLGRDLGRSGNWQRGLTVLEQYGEDFPEHSRIGNLPWYIGDMLVENRLWQQAIPWFQLTLERYPYNVTADDAHFYLCFSLIKSGGIPAAIIELKNFISRWTSSVYLSSAKYWLGKLLYSEGNPEGMVILEELIQSAPASLPAFFARELLGQSAWEPDFTEEPLDEWMTRHGHTPALPPEAALRGLFLLEAGLRNFADGEFRKAEEIVGGPDYLAPFYLEYNVWERRPISGYNMWDLSGSEIDRPRELWMLRYQMAWPELVVPAGEKYGLDSLFAWAIIRNESMFQPTCYSVAGARGLIQMIPSTSEYVAIEQGWDDYSPDRLYDPAVSIEYGISYISGVNRDLGGDPVMTAAAYNGGPHNAVHWGAEDMEPDEFFALITYNETKNYTQNVHHAYMIYKALYLGPGVTSGYLPQ